MLHVHCGDSSAEQLRKSEVAGDVIVWGDPVCDGPTPAHLTPHAWLEVRAAYLAAQSAHLTADKVSAHLSAQDVALAQFSAHDEVVLWYDACLFDQSILIRALDWFAQHALGATRVSLLCIGEFPGRSRFLGLGELNPAELAALFPQRHTVTDEELALGQRAWAAYCAPDPTAVQQLIDDDTSALPYLREALIRHLQQLPDRRDGLNRLEREILYVVRVAHADPATIFTEVSATEARPFFGDTMLWHVIEEMACVPTPLLTLIGPGPLPRFDDSSSSALSAWTVGITALGSAVLAGQADAVHRRGIDRWVGGVHLGTYPTWRWDEEAGRVVRVDKS